MAPRAFLVGVLFTFGALVSCGGPPASTASDDVEVPPSSPGSLATAVEAGSDFSAAPTTVNAASSAGESGAEDDQMECGVADFSSSLIALVTGAQDEPIAPAPEIGRGFYSSSILVTSVGWQTSSAERLGIARLLEPVKEGSSYPVLLFGDETMVGRFEELLRKSSESGHLIMLGLSGVGEQIPGLRLYGTLTSDAFESPSGCDALRTSQLQNISTFTGAKTFASALSMVADEVQLMSERPGPIELSADGVDEPAPNADEAWYATDPEIRSLRFEDVPVRERDKLALVPIQFVLSSAEATQTISVVCELGVGWLSSAEAVGAVSPVSVCRSGTTAIQVDGADVARYSVEDFNALDGSRLTIDLSSGAPKVSVFSLADGDLEKILGVTPDQLEALRRQYSAAGP